LYGERSPQNGSPSLDLNEWAYELNKRVYNEWKTQFLDWKQGFKTLYGWPLETPSLMVISLNPGGDESSFAKDRARFESGDFSSPQKPPYLTSTYRFAIKLRDLFGDHVELLRETVAFPVCFFRSERWSSIPRHTKNKMKQFCFPIVRDMIRTMPPERLLVIGLNTYGKLESILGGFKEEREVLFREGGKTSTLVKESKWGDVPVFATVHLTGFRISRNEWAEMKQRFDLWLSEGQF
jgi:hypothetical protein